MLSKVSWLLTNDRWSKIKLLSVTVQRKIETVIRDICGILTVLLGITYILITNVFHAILTIDLRLNPHSNHVLQQQLLECLSEQRKWSLSILSYGLTSIVYIDSPELPVTQMGTWTEASCFWQCLSSHSEALLTPQWGPLPKTYHALLQRQSLKCAGSSGKVLRAVERG